MNRKNWACYSVKHRTEYRYDQPAVLEPHVLRLCPRQDCWQAVRSCRIDLFPFPDKLTEYLDVEGNIHYYAFFPGRVTDLVIESAIEVQIRKRNPLDFVVYPFEASEIPFEYPAAVIKALSNYLDSVPEDPRVEEFTERVKSEVGRGTISFLTGLAARISREFGRVRREEGRPYTASELLDAGCGACRDLANFFIACSRREGIAARFVSGYFLDEQLDGRFDLHSWAEVYIPGAGWIGFDPSIGVSVTDRHITVSASFLPERTLPVYGSYWSTGTSRFSSTVHLERVPVPADFSGNFT